MISTAPDRTHDFILSLTSTGKSWHLQWTRRVLSVAGVEDTSLRDLLHEFLRVGTHAGLLKLLAETPEKKLYGINWTAATLISGGEKLVCSETGHTVVRPPNEAAIWEGAPSLAYNAKHGVYRRDGFAERERYYQQRYRRGAIRRVSATEHTGLLTNDEREDVERRFAVRESADDPNIITCTSTLEMGIDIGDLSATMLCSVPPTTANYLQRIGRAGRATGTALVVSIINQRPHDLFFFARPDQMLQGKVQPPGCWLDAAAVLVRQYLAYCFDTAGRLGVITRLPGTAVQLHDEVMSGQGTIPVLIQWISLQQESLQATFMARFGGDVVQSDTRQRFRRDAAVEVLRGRLEKTAREFDLQRREVQNAQRRLRDQRANLHAEDDRDEIREIERELRLLGGRLQSLNRTAALELLTDHGLLPNYAFPERGVRFYGAVYNQRGNVAERDEPKEYEAVRHASVALRELAPSNHFYMRSRVFDIQAIALGSPTEPLVEEWAICGACGHSRRKDELTRPDAVVACPQCGEAQGSGAQADAGQHRKMLHFARSEAVSYMEAYASLSGDKSDEREPQIYRIADSFDFAGEGEAGAMGEEVLPFGIEYRANATLRQINGGYHEEPADLPAGHEQLLPREGFRVCRDCGRVAEPFEQSGKMQHRRSCRAFRTAERQKQRGQPVDAFNMEHVYLYRELNSEVLRLLLPDVSEDELTTLIACVQLGLRLKFQGEPGNLRAISRPIPDSRSGIIRNFLILVDAVPGGTGFLKTLYQAEDNHGRKGEGVMDIFRLALQQLEECVCRRFTGAAVSDGCYRCIRHYHLQHRASQISRERGIVLLQRLIAAGERRVEIQALDAINPQALFGSQLERNFINNLKKVVGARMGHWEETIVRGARGYRFSLGGTEARMWDVELQPELGPRHGVNMRCQPDFLLSCDDTGILPIAVFADGFEPHVHPGESANRLADDFQKRRAILASGRYRSWSVTWNDLKEGESAAFCFKPPFVQMLQRFADQRTQAGYRRIDATQITGHGFTQLVAFLEHPASVEWQDLVRKTAMALLAGVARHATQRISDARLSLAFSNWSSGNIDFEADRTDGKGWVATLDLAHDRDFLAALKFDGERPVDAQLMLHAVLGDSQLERSSDGYRDRWRRLLALSNLLQFSEGFSFHVTSESAHVAAEFVSSASSRPLSREWRAIAEQSSVVIRMLVEALARAESPLPRVEHYPEDLPEEIFGELAWPDRRIVVLVGDQSSFASLWRSHGWTVFVDDDVASAGPAALITLLK